MTICDTVGYGDQINKDDSFKSLVDHIDLQFEAYLQEELKIKRSISAYHDSRIHACLYFICPTGHGLKSLDLVCMKKLDTKVNIIPIIAKADTISKTELAKFKVNFFFPLKFSKHVCIYTHGRLIISKHFTGKNQRRTSSEWSSHLSLSNR